MAEYLKSERQALKFVFPPPIIMVMGQMYVMVRKRNARNVVASKSHGQRSLSLVTCMWHITERREC